MQGFGLVLIAVALGFAGGCMVATQPSINGSLGRSVTHPLQASLVSFGTGTVVIVSLLIALGHFPPRFTTPPSELPRWIWLGGAIGVFMVTCSLIFVPRIGSLPWMAAVMTGQTLTALMIDHHGWLGNPRTALSPLRIAGALLLIAGVMLIVYAKRLEHQAATQDSTLSVDSSIPLAPATDRQPDRR